MPTFFIIDLTGDIFEEDSLKALINRAAKFYAESGIQPDLTLKTAFLYTGGKVYANDKLKEIFLDRLEKAIELEREELKERNSGYVDDKLLPSQLW
jgi:hypothetical protein